MNGLKLAERVLNHEMDFEVASSDYATPVKLGVIERKTEEASNRLKALAGDRFSSLISAFRHFRDIQEHQYDAPYSTRMSNTNYRELDKIEKELKSLVEE